MSTQDTSTLVPVFRLLKTAIKDAFDKESPLELDRALEFQDEIQSCLNSLEYGLLPSIPDISWYLNLGHAPNSSQYGRSLANQFIILLRDGTLHTATDEARHYTWAVRGYSSDILCWKRVGE